MEFDKANSQGQIFLHRGNLSLARLWFDQAVTKARELQTCEPLIASLGNLGNVCALLGDFQEAEGCYREILEIQKNVQNHHAIGETLVNLGNLKSDAGEREPARAYYLEAIDVLMPLQHHRALGIAFSNLALLEFSSNPSTAIGYFLNALDSHRMVGDEQGLANTYSQLGYTYLSWGKNQEAERCLNNASEHFIKLGKEREEAAVLRTLAHLYNSTHDALSAIRCLERVIQIDLRYQLSEYQEDWQNLTELKNR